MTDQKPPPAPRPGGKASVPDDESQHMDFPEPIDAGEGGGAEGFDWDDEDDAAIGGAWDAYRRRMHPDPDDPAPPELLTAEWWWRPPGVEIDLHSLKQAFHCTHHPDDQVYGRIDDLFRTHPDRRAAVPAYAQWIFPKITEALDRWRWQQEAEKREEQARRASPEAPPPRP